MWIRVWLACRSYSAQKMKFSIKDFFSKRDQIRSFLKISKWSETLAAMQMEWFIILKVMMEYSSMILIGNSLPKELISLFFTNVSFYCSVFSISRQRRIQNSVKYQKSSFLGQRLHLRCLTGFWIPLCMTNAQSVVEHWNIGNIGKKLIAQISPWQILL